MPIRLTRDLAIQILQADRKARDVFFEGLKVANKKIEILNADRKARDVFFEGLKVANKKIEILNKVAWDYDTSKHCADWETIVTRAQGYIDCAIQSTTDEQALQILREVQS